MERDVFKLKTQENSQKHHHSKLDANPGTELKSEAAFAAAIRALKKKVSHVHDNTTATTRTHIPAVKATAPSSLGLAAGLGLAPDPLLTPVGDWPSPALPPAELPSHCWGSPALAPGFQGRRAGKQPEGARLRVPAPA